MKATNLHWGQTAYIILLHHCLAPRHGAPCTQQLLQPLAQAAHPLPLCAHTRCMLLTLSRLRCLCCRAGRCVAQDPQERPSASQLVSLLAGLQHSLRASRSGGSSPAPSATALGPEQLLPVGVEVGCAPATHASAHCGQYQVPEQACWLGQEGAGQGEQVVRGGAPGPPAHHEPQRDCATELKLAEFLQAERPQPQGRRQGVGSRICAPSMMSDG